MWAPSDHRRLEARPPWAVAAQVGQIVTSTRVVKSTNGLYARALAHSSLAVAATLSDNTHRRSSRLLLFRCRCVCLVTAECIVAREAAPQWRPHHAPWRASRVLCMIHTHRTGSRHRDLVIDPYTYTPLPPCAMEVGTSRARPVAGLGQHRMCASKAVSVLQMYRSSNRITLITRTQRTRPADLLRP